MTLARWIHRGASATVAGLLCACSHSGSAAHDLPPLAPAAASIVLVETRQQVIAGHPCPAGFLRSELPGDWCYRVGEAAIRPGDIATKAVVHDSNSMRWVIRLDLRPEAETRFEAFSAKHAGEDSAIVDDATVLAVIPLPKIDPQLSTSHWNLDAAWTEQQARRIERSLGGTDIPNRPAPVCHPGAGNEVICTP